MGEINFTEGFFWFALGIVFSFITSLFLLLISYEVTMLKKKVRWNLLFIISITFLIVAFLLWIFEIIPSKIAIVLSSVFLFILILWFFGILFPKKVHKCLHDSTYEKK